jgi:AmiR/NasT family two-component response regulator
MRILILEDEWSIAMDLEGIVASAGHRALGPVATAVEALEMVERTPPDLPFWTVDSWMECRGQRSPSI